MLRKKGIKRGGIKRKPARIASKGKKRAVRAISISKLMKEADRLFSLKVRQTRPYDEYEDFVSVGLNRCYTCRRVFSIKKLHCGHYLSRFYKSARWDKDNCRPQCMMCNLWKRGDPITFRQNLIREIGEKRVKAVEAKRNEHIKLTREYLNTLIETLQ